jgi:hypothetical protein
VILPQISNPILRTSVACCGTSCRLSIPLRITLKQCATRASRVVLGVWSARKKRFGRGRPGTGEATRECVSLYIRAYGAKLVRNPDPQHLSWRGICRSSLDELKSSTRYRNASTPPLSFGKAGPGKVLVNESLSVAIGFLNQLS